MDIELAKEGLQNACDEIKALKKRWHMTKRCHDAVLIQQLIRKEFGVYVPLKKNSGGWKDSDFAIAINSLARKQYYQGIISEKLDNKEKID